MEECKALLQESEINASVRKGDLYGFMIEHYARNHNYKEALAHVQQLKTAIANVNLAYYVNTDVLQLVEKKMGVVLQVEDKLSTNQDEEED